MRSRSGASVELDKGRRPARRLQRGHRAQEAGPVGKFGAADAVVDVDVRVIDRPSPSRRIGARVLDLTR